MGDVKLAGVMGLFLGFEVIPALFGALVAGSVVGLGQIATAIRRLMRRSTVRAARALRS